MKKTVFVLLLFMFCGAIAEDTNKPVAFTIDAGFEQIDTTNPNHMDQRNQIRDYIVKDIVKRFNSDGINLVPNSDTVKSEGLELKYKIDLYNAGSKAARMLVGFGAGHCTLETTVILVKDGTVLQKESFSSVSSVKWEKCVKQTSKYYLKLFSKKLL